MEDVEQRALISSPVKPLFWKRYVDDVISAVSKNEVENLLSHLNSEWHGIAWALGILGDKLDKVESRQFPVKQFYKVQCK